MCKFLGSIFVVAILFLLVNFILVSVDCLNACACIWSFRIIKYVFGLASFPLFFISLQVKLSIVYLRMKEASKILFISQEICPYLDETPYSLLGRKLPPVAQENGCETRTFMPKFGEINERRNQLHEVIRLSGMNLIIEDTDHPLIIKVASIQAARMQVYFIDSDDYFRRRKSVADENGVEYEDNDERCIFFARGVLETVKKLRWTPDIIHCQGWMAALAPLFVKKGYHDDPFFHDSKVVLSLLDKEYVTPFRDNFAEKVRMEEMQDSDLQDIMSKPVDYETLMKLAIDYSDGVIQATPTVRDSLVTYAKEKGVEFMDYAGMDNYQAYIDFYNSLL